MSQQYCYHCGRIPATDFQRVQIGWSGDAKVYSQRPFCKECNKSDSISWLYGVLVALAIALVFLAGTLYDEYSYIP